MSTTRGWLPSSAFRDKYGFVLDERGDRVAAGISVSPVWRAFVKKPEGDDLSRPSSSLVAVKEVTTSGSYSLVDPALAKILAEAELETLRTLAGHPHVVRILDAYAYEPLGFGGEEEEEVDDGSQGARVPGAGDVGPGVGTGAGTTARTATVIGRSASALAAASSLSRSTSASAAATATTTTTTTSAGSGEGPSAAGGPSSPPPLSSPLDPYISAHPNHPCYRIVMPLARGGDLSTFAAGIMQAEGVRPTPQGAAVVLSEPLAADILLQIADAVLHTHRKRLVNRDLKVQNVLVLREPLGLEYHRFVSPGPGGATAVPALCVGYAGDYSRTRAVERGELTAVPVPVPAVPGSGAAAPLSSSAPRSYASHTPVVHAHRRLPFVAVTDFGTARPEARASRTFTTMANAPPEQFERGPYRGNKFDAWLVGMILATLLLGDGLVATLQWRSNARNVASFRVDPTALEIPPDCGLSAGACDVLRRLLDVDPDTRLSISDLLQHEWMAPAKARYAAAVSEQFFGADAEEDEDEEEDDDVVEGKRRSVVDAAPLVPNPHPTRHERRKLRDARWRALDEEAERRRRAVGPPAATSAPSSSTPSSSPPLPPLRTPSLFGVVHPNDDDGGEPASPLPQLATMTMTTAGGWGSGPLANAGRRKADALRIVKAHQDLAQNLALALPPEAARRIVVEEPLGPAAAALAGPTPTSPLAPGLDDGLASTKAALDEAKEALREATGAHSFEDVPAGEAGAPPPALLPPTAPQPFRSVYAFPGGGGVRPSSLAHKPPAGASPLRTAGPIKAALSSASTEVAAMNTVLLFRALNDAAGAIDVHAGADAGADTAALRALRAAGERLAAAAEHWRIVSAVEREARHIATLDSRVGVSSLHLTLNHARALKPFIANVCTFCSVRNGPADARPYRGVRMQLLTALDVVLARLLRPNDDSADLECAAILDFAFAHLCNVLRANIRTRRAGSSVPAVGDADGSLAGQTTLDVYSRGTLQRCVALLADIVQSPLFQWGATPNEMARKLAVLLPVGSLGDGDGDGDAEVAGGGAGRGDVLPWALLWALSADNFAREKQYSSVMPSISTLLCSALRVASKRLLPSSVALSPSRSSPCGGAAVTVVAWLPSAVLHIEAVTARLLRHAHRTHLMTIVELVGELAEPSQRAARAVGLARVRASHLRLLHSASEAAAAGLFPLLPPLPAPEALFPSPLGSLATVLASRLLGALQAALLAEQVQDACRVCVLLYRLVGDSAPLAVGSQASTPTQPFSPAASSTLSPAAKGKAAQRRDDFGEDEGDGDGDGDGEDWPPRGGASRLPPPPLLDAATRTLVLSLLRDGHVLISRVAALVGLLVNYQFDLPDDLVCPVLLLLKACALPAHTPPALDRMGPANGRAGIRLPLGSQSPAAVASATTPASPRAAPPGSVPALFAPSSPLGSLADLDWEPEALWRLRRSGAAAGLRDLVVRYSSSTPILSVGLDLVNALLDLDLPSPQPVNAAQQLHASATWRSSWAAPGLRRPGSFFKEAPTVTGEGPGKGDAGAARGPSASARNVGLLGLNPSTTLLLGAAAAATSAALATSSASDPLGGVPSGVDPPSQTTMTASASGASASSDSEGGGGSVLVPPSSDVAAAARHARESWAFRERARGSAFARAEAPYVEPLEAALRKEAQWGIKDVDNSGGEHAESARLSYTSMPGLSRSLLTFIPALAGVLHIRFSAAKAVVARERKAGNFAVPYVPPSDTLLLQRLLATLLRLCCFDGAARILYRSNRGHRHPAAVDVLLDILERDTSKYLGYDDVGGGKEGRDDNHLPPVTDSALRLVRILLESPALRGRVRVDPVDNAVKLLLDRVFRCCREIYTQSEAAAALAAAGGALIMSSPSQRGLGGGGMGGASSPQPAVIATRPSLGRAPSSVTGLASSTPGDGSGAAAGPGTPGAPGSSASSSASRLLPAVLSDLIFSLDTLVVFAQYHLDDAAARVPSAAAAAAAPLAGSPLASSRVVHNSTLRLFVANSFELLREVVGLLDCGLPEPEGETVRGAARRFLAEVAVIDEMAGGEGGGGARVRVGLLRDETRLLRRLAAGLRRSADAEEGSGGAPLIQHLDALPALLPSPDVPQAAYPFVVEGGVAALGRIFSLPTGDVPKDVAVLVDVLARLVDCCEHGPMEEVRRQMGEAEGGRDAPRTALARRLLQHGFVPLEARPVLSPDEEHALGFPSLQALRSLAGAGILDAALLRDDGDGDEDGEFMDDDGGEEGDGGGRRGALTPGVPASPVYGPLRAAGAPGALAPALPLNPGADEWRPPSSVAAEHATEPGPAPAAVVVVAGAPPVAVVAVGGGGSPGDGERVDWDAEFDW
jgi:serine/threonine protein kinase